MFVIESDVVYLLLLDEHHVTLIVIESDVSYVYWNMILQETIVKLFSL